MTPITISVLDQSPVSQGSTGAEAMRNTLDLAKLSEELGYHRYWVAEHHGTPMLACASPEVMISAIGAATSHIRIGSGGVMLPHYSPLKVAETFSILSALYPGRVDLGIGRAPGSDQLTAVALQRDRRQRPPDDFPNQLAELTAFLHDRMPPDHAFARLTALPGLPHIPELYLLGSSPQSAIWAAEAGLPYVFADFINPEGAEMARQYREHFIPSTELAKPFTMVAVWAVAADSDEEAQRVASSARMARALMNEGKLIAVPPIETALDYLAKHSVAKSPFGQMRQRRAVVGSPENVRTGLEAVAKEYGADEVMVVTITYEHAARRRSYELIAQAFGLTGQASRQSDRALPV